VSFDKGQPPYDLVDKVMYSGVRVFAEVGAALDGFTGSDRATDFFEKGLILVSRIADEQMRICACRPTVRRSQNIRGSWRNDRELKEVS
jgi:hypothetical protein